MGEGGLQLVCLHVSLMLVSCIALVCKAVEVHSACNSEHQDTHGGTISRIYPWLYACDWVGMINACPVIQCNFLHRVMHMKTIHGGMMWLECNFANQSPKNNLSIIVYCFNGVS